MNMPSGEWIRNNSRNLRHENKLSRSGENCSHPAALKSSHPPSSDDAK
jgi:hypothetical protein